MNSYTFHHKTHPIPTPKTRPYQAVCNQISCQILQNPCTAHMPPGCLLGTSKNSGKSLCFCMSPQKGCQHQYNINYINSQKTFKTLVKMNNFTVLPCASHSSMPSGSWLPHWIPQGAPSKTVENPCVSEVWPLEFHWRS